MYFRIDLLLVVQWPICLHWPFCPGVFIALLGLLAAVVTFWESPPRFVKVISILLFTALMCSEIWMMSKDRDNHDKSEKDGRDIEDQQSAKLDFLTIQSGQAVTAMLDIEREQRKAKGNTALLASLQSKADAARARVDSSAKQFAIALEPNIAKQIASITDRFEMTMTQLNDNYGNAESMLDSDPRKQQRMSSFASAKIQETATYQDRIVGLLNIAYPMQQQLLRGLTQNARDQEMEGMIKNALGRDFSSFGGKSVAFYLDELAKRASK